MDVIIIGAGIGGLTLAWLSTGNTMAPCVIIGERDTELVRESHRIHPIASSRRARLRSRQRA